MITNTMIEKIAKMAATSAFFHVHQAATAYMVDEHTNDDWNTLYNYCDQRTGNEMRESQVTVLTDRVADWLIANAWPTDFQPL